jgi:hypothetical protein
MLGAPTTVSSRRRCRDCRRPDGQDILAHKDGYYAVPFHERSVAVIRPDGWPVLDEGTVAAQLDRPGWRIVRVELDDDGRCKRCAYLQLHPEQRPKLEPPKHTFNGERKQWQRR